MWIATIPVICFTFNSQISISECCHQSLLCAAERVQCAGGTAANSAAYCSESGGGYQTKSDPDVIVDEVFMPYFEDRMNVC
jgi:hypothetical protein